MNKTRILLVDDNVGFGETVQEFFKLRGYEVQLATDIAIAKNLIAQNPPALAIIDKRLINPEDDYDESGLALAKQLDVHLPKIILTDYPTVQNVREMLRPGADGKPIALDFVDKKEGLHALLTSVRLALAQLPSTLEGHVLKTFQAPTLQALRRRLNDLGPRDALKYLQTAEARTEDELAPQRDAALRRAAQLHTFGLVAKSVVLSLLTAAILLLLLDLTSAGKVSAMAGALAKCFDLWWGKKEEHARQKADELYEELQKTRQGAHWLLMCEAFEDAQTRDEYRKKVIEHILSQR